MARKKSSAKKPAARRNPLFIQGDSLQFGDVEVMALSDEQKQDLFMSKWLENVSPFTTLPRIFRHDNPSLPQTMHTIKVLYRTLVIEGDWPERKYAQVINAVFEEGITLSQFSAEKYGKLHDKNELPAQVRARRKKS